MTTFDEASNKYLPSTLFGGDWESNKHALDPAFGIDIPTQSQTYRNVALFLHRERHDGENFLGEMAFKWNNYGSKPRWYHRTIDEFCNQITSIMVMDMWRGELHTKSYMFQREALDLDTYRALPKEQCDAPVKAQCEAYAEAISRGLSANGIETTAHNYQVNHYGAKNNCRIWFKPLTTQPTIPIGLPHSPLSVKTFDQHIQYFDNMYTQTITKTASGKVRLSDLVDLSVKVKTGYESARAAFESINGSPQEPSYDKGAYVDSVSRARTRLFAYDSIAGRFSNQAIHVPYTSESECPKIKSAFVLAMSKYKLAGQVSSMHYASRNIFAFFF